jgi:hypothetical protein
MCVDFTNRWLAHTLWRQKNIASRKIWQTWQISGNSGKSGNPGTQLYLTRHFNRYFFAFEKNSVYHKKNPIFKFGRGGKRVAPSARFSSDTAFLVEKGYVRKNVFEK